MNEYRSRYIDIFIGAIALFLGGPAFQHWLAYYRYPHMRCITIFELNPDSRKEETLEL